MRTKDLDEVLPNADVDVTDEAIVIDGARTAMVNGVVSQNGLELILRMERVGKALLKGAAEARVKVQAAVDDGMAIQDGNREAGIEEKTGNVSHKNIFEKLLKDEGLKTTEIKARCEALGYKQQNVVLLEALDIDPDDYFETEKDELVPTKTLVIK